MPVKELTKRQLERQDDVDNACFNLLTDLAGDKASKLEWDMEHISAVREAVQEVLVDKLHLMTEQEFYPYLEDKGKTPKHGKSELYAPVPSDEQGLDDLQTGAPQPAKVVITIDGGAVHDVLSTVPLKYLVVDHDIENYEEGELTTMKREAGEDYQVALEESEVAADLEGVEHYWKQIPAA